MMVRSNDNDNADGDDDSSRYLTYLSSIYLANHAIILSTGMIMSTADR
jgi:hypothetical protein